MKYLIITALALLSAGAIAAPPTIPPVVGRILNQAGGEIVIFTARGSCPDTKYVAWTRLSSGQVTGWGCWQMVGSSIIVLWDSDDLYEYPLALVELDPEFVAFSDRVESQSQGPRSSL